MVRFQASSNATGDIRNLPHVMADPVGSDEKARFLYEDIYSISAEQNRGILPKSPVQSREIYECPYFQSTADRLGFYHRTPQCKTYRQAYKHQQHEKLCHLRAITTTVATLAFKAARYQYKGRDCEEMNQVFLDSMRMLKRRLRCKRVSRSSDLMVHSNYSLITSIDNILQPINVSL